MNSHTQDKINIMIEHGKKLGLSLADILNGVQKTAYAEKLITLSSDQKRTEYLCPTCGNEHSTYKVYFSNVHLKILIKVFKHVSKTGQNEFQKKDVPGLTHTDYGNFYILQRFGLLYFTKDGQGKRVKGGYWGMPHKRVRDFLKGDFMIAEYFERNTGNKTNTMSETRIPINKIRQVSKVITDPRFDITPSFVEYSNNFGE